MTYDLLIRNVGVVRPNEHAVHKADIAIQGEKFARIEPNLDPEKRKRVWAPSAGAACSSGATRRRS